VINHEAKPFLKWVGGKRKIMPAILPLVPVSFARYHEPFLGGGALFFRLMSEGRVLNGVTLSDGNMRLVRAYIGVRDSAEDVISLLESYPYEKSFYLSLRSMNIDTGSDAEVAAWMIYLNKTGYNGLYRVNLDNGFNVPFGRYTSPTICDPVGLRACSDALRGVDILHNDFTVSSSRVLRGDFVYYDPPYVPLTTTSSFTSYTPGGFGENEQRKLAHCAREVASRGAHVLLSNSSAPLVREIYADGFSLSEVDCSRSVNSKGKGRGKIKELLVRPTETVA
jgi:DNA adenine methylase